MLKFHYHPLSPVARGVWLLLLEKQIPFEPIVMDIRTRNPDLLAINPFHHVPVIIDGDLRLLESIAILDYLELKYPQIAFSPKTPEAIAQMRMIQMATINEIVPTLSWLVMANGEILPTATEQRIATTLAFLTEQLGTDVYFGGDCLDLADIAVGTIVPLVHRLGYALDEYPALEKWRQRIIDRPAWQQTRPDDDDFKQWQRWIKILIQRRKK
jgi:glutathione S-transferase